MIFAEVVSAPVTTNFLFLAFEIAIGLIVSVIYIRSRIPKETIKEQAALITTLQIKSDEQTKKIDEQAKQLAESLKLIHNLEGQVEAYKVLPFTDLKSTMESVATSNQQIVDQLKQSAQIEAEERKEKV